jgi:hypothetical protein
MRRAEPGTDESRVPDDLQRLQKLFYRLVVAPEGVDEGLAAEAPTGGIETILTGDDRLSARNRLEIYANAYFYRLLDVLKEEFPATLEVIGEANFHNLVTGYLIEYPPTEPSILYAGRNLADFLRAHPLIERWPYSADLAQLERACLDVFHELDARTLDAATMRLVLPAEWPGLVLKTQPASRILDLDWPVHDIMRAVEKGEKPPEPEPAPTSVLVWRQDSRAHYRALETIERRALGLARDGREFAGICEAIAEEADPREDPIALINSLVARWLREGVLTDANSKSAPPKDAAS